MVLIPFLVYKLDKHKKFQKISLICYLSPKKKEKYFWLILIIQYQN